MDTIILHPVRVSKNIFRIQRVNDGSMTATIIIIIIILVSSVVKMPRVKNKVKNGFWS